MKPDRILVVEDDAAIRQGLVDALESSGLHGARSRRRRRGSVPWPWGPHTTSLLLDLILPGADGFDILREVRANRPTVPVIILTARGEEDDRVRGLKLGADDYVVKPFSVKELLARVEAVLRRAPDATPDVSSVVFTGGQADFASRQVRFDDGTTTDLSDRELALLRYLAVNSGRAVSREELLARVWGITARGIETRTVDVHIARLREKLRDDAASPRTIRTVRGKGYAFEKGPRLRSQRYTWIGFGLCAATVLAAMTWVTAVALRLDRAQTEARRQAAVEEAARLALWRMDAAMTAIVAKESAWPYFAYTSFYPPERAYTRMFAALRARAKLLCRRRC